MLELYTLHKVLRGVSRIIQIKRWYKTSQIMIITEHFSTIYKLTLLVAINLSSCDVICCNQLCMQSKLFQSGIENNRF